MFAENQKFCELHHLNQKWPPQAKIFKNRTLSWPDFAFSAYQIRKIFYPPHNNTTPPTCCTPPTIAQISIPPHNGNFKIVNPPHYSGGGGNYVWDRRGSSTPRPLRDRSPPDLAP